MLGMLLNRCTILVVLPRIDEFDLGQIMSNYVIQ